MAEVPIAGPDGIVWVPEGELTEAELSLAGSHHNAIQAFLSGADPDGTALARVEGESIHNVPLVTDRDRVLELDEDDLLTFEQFYEKRKQ